MFHEVLLYSRTKNSIQGQGKATWKKVERLQKRLKRGNLSGCLVNVFYYIYSYIWYITDLDVDVGKLPNHLKLCVLYLSTLDQFLLYFIIQQSPIDWDSLCCNVCCGSIIIWKNLTYNVLYCLSIISKVLTNRKNKSLKIF